MVTGSNPVRPTRPVASVEAAGLLFCAVGQLEVALHSMRRQPAPDALILFDDAAL